MSGPGFLSVPFSCFHRCKMATIAPDINSLHDCNHRKEAGKQNRPCPVYCFLFIRMKIIFPEAFPTDFPFISAAEEADKENSHCCFQLLVRKVYKGKEDWACPWMACLSDCQNPSLWPLTISRHHSSPITTVGGMLHPFSMGEQM